MITRTMIINDIHRPFHDEKSLNLVLDIFEERNLDRLIINGDFEDYYNLSMHGPKNPSVIEDLLFEMEDGKEFFTKLRKRFPNKHIVVNGGNHESRLDRFILQNAKPFWGVLTTEKFFEFDRLGIEYYPYNNKYQIEKTNCFVQHSPPSYASAKQCLNKKLDQTFIYGCTHREEKATLTGASGQVYAAYFNGWLGDENSKVFEYAKGHQNWQQCFIIVNVIDEVEFHIEQISIRNHKCVVDGYLYEA